MIPVLEVRNLSKIYSSGSKKVTAVDDISFELNEGQILGFLGPNGAGKTTTIQMLLSTLRPTDGEIIYFGKSLIKNRSEVLQEVSSASAYSRLPWGLSILENLIVYARMYGLPRKRAMERIEKFLRFFEMWEVRDKLTGALSAGQATRVMLAKAFLAHPRIVLLDEPTASLDPDIAHEVRRFVLKQRSEYGVSILYTSHNMDEVAEVCDKVTFLKKGQIVASDTPKTLASQLRLSVVRLLVEQGEDRLQLLLNDRGITMLRDEESLHFSLPAQDVGSLLSEVGTRGVTYRDISIEHPTLEEFFLNISKEGT